MPVLNLRISTDDTELNYVSTNKKTGRHTYIYTKAITLTGKTVELSDDQLFKIQEMNSYKQIKFLPTNFEL